MLHRPLIAALLLVPLMALAVQAATDFQDIPAGHWGRRAAAVLAERQILPGRTPVDFAGANPLSRYELAWTISHLYNVEGPPSIFVVLSDMPPGHTATLEVQRVMGYDLIPARGPGKFAGDLPASKKEVIEALESLFVKNGVTPPARKTAVIFSDVPANTPFGQAVDHIVNRFALIDAKAGGAFNPTDSLNRYQFLSMIARAMRYLRPSIARELEASPPPVVASLPPGSSPQPGSSATPTPVPSSVVLRSRAWAKGELLALYREDLPTDPGLTVAGEQRQFAGALLPGGGAVVEVWSGAMGVTFDVSSYYIGFDVPVNGKLVANNLLDTLVHAEWLYQVPLSPDAQLAFGGVGAFRQSFNLSSVGNMYLTADKTYIGVGPALSLGMRLTPALALSGGVDAYPLIQSYALTTGSKTITRWGVYPRVRLEYSLGGGLLATGGLSAVVGAGGGGMQTMVGANLGLGATF